MPQFVRRALTLTACMALMLSGAAMAQSYKLQNLTSNLSGKAKHTDVLLANPWGLAYGPSAPFWISDEASGYSTLYDGQGNPQPLQVIVPPTSGTVKGTPTGIVYNGSTEFQIEHWTSLFLFATIDGTISGWSDFFPSAALIGARRPVRFIRDSRSRARSREISCMRPMSRAIRWTSTTRRSRSWVR